MKRAIFSFPRLLHINKSHRVTKANVVTEEADEISLMDAWGSTLLLGVCIEAQSQFAHTHSKQRQWVLMFTKFIFKFHYRWRNMHAYKGLALCSLQMITKQSGWMMAASSRVKWHTSDTWQRRAFCWRDTIFFSNNQGLHLATQRLPTLAYCKLFIDGWMSSGSQRASRESHWSGGSRHSARLGCKKHPETLLTSEREEQRCQTMNSKVQWKVNSINCCLS